MEVNDEFSYSNDIDFEQGVPTQTNQDQEDPLKNMQEVNGSKENLAEAKNNDKENKPKNKRNLVKKLLGSSKSSGTLKDIKNIAGNPILSDTFDKPSPCKSPSTSKVGGTHSLSQSCSSQTLRNNLPRTRQQLSRTQLLPTSPSVPSIMVSPASSKMKSMNSSKNLPRKNFVKANVLAASSSATSRVVNKSNKTSNNSELQVSGTSLQTSNISRKGKQFGSSRSLNSEPGTSSSPTTSFKRGIDQPARKSCHNYSTRSSKANVGVGGGKSQQTRKLNKRRSQTSIVHLHSDQRKKSPKPVRLSPNNQARNENNISEQNLTTDDFQGNQVLKSPTETNSSRRSSISRQESEIIKSLKQKQEHVQLLMENLQSDISELKHDLEKSKEEKKELEVVFKEEINLMTQKFDVEKQELKEFFLCQLEQQRQELREEIRKLLSFKDLGPLTPSKDGEKGKSFKDSKEKLFHKIHRLSARMSMQDMDMKEMQEVKTWNEKKLENELTRLQDSSVKKQPTDKSRISVSEDSRNAWTSKQGFLEQQLASAGRCSIASVSEPDLTMFDTDSGVISMKMQTLAPSMSTLEAFPPPSPALVSNVSNKFNERQI